MVYWRKIVLFGDSLTQYGFQPRGWCAALADAMQRKADVLNRGFSGYNTDNAVDMLHLEFPRGSLEERDVVTVFFGANDAVLRGFDQHVPLERFEKNIGQIIRHFVSLGLPKNQILVISPPPVDSKAWLADMIANDRGNKCSLANDVTKCYAELSKKVAAENCCPFVDVWNTFMAEESYEKLLSDGLHFSEAGNQLLAKLVVESLSEMSENWKMNYPDWKEFYNPSATST